MRGAVGVLFGNQHLLLLLKQQWILQLQSLLLLFDHVLIETEALRALRAVHRCAGAASTMMFIPSK